jgi:hypothetical protein
LRSEKSRILAENHTNYFNAGVGLHWLPKHSNPGLSVKPQSPMLLLHNSMSAEGK